MYLLLIIYQYVFPPVRAAYQDLQR